MEKQSKNSFLFFLVSFGVLVSCSGGGDAENTRGDSLRESFDFSTAELENAGFGSAFVANVQEFIDTLDAGAASTADGSFTLPTAGTVDFTGTSIVSDVNFPDTVDTVADAAPYLFVSGTSLASVDLAAGTMSVTMGNFVSAEDNAITGTISGSGTFAPGSQLFSGTVSGNVAGTTFSAIQNGVVFGDSSSADGVFGSFFGSGPNGGVIGSGGPYDGDEINGAFAAD